MKNTLQPITVLFVIILLISCKSYHTPEKSVRYTGKTHEQQLEENKITTTTFFGYHLDTLYNVLNDYILTVGPGFDTITSETLQGNWIKWQPNYLTKGDWSFSFTANSIRCSINLDPEFSYFVFIEKINGRLVIVRYDVELF